jgi:hypothetical protein
MNFRLIIAGIALSTMLVGNADARLLSNHCCARTVKCKQTEKSNCGDENACCEAYAETGSGVDGRGTYNAIVGPDGIYGVNTSTGKVYKYNEATGQWDNFTPAMP